MKPVEPLRRAAAWRRLAPILLLASMGALSACGGSKPPTSFPPQTLASTPPTEVPPSTAQEPQTPESDATAKGKTVIIEEPLPPDRPRTLVEAAAEARSQRQAAGEPLVVITNENLAAHATGDLTFVSEPAAEESPAPAGEEATLETRLRQDEQYWRARVLEARLKWKAAVDEIETLQAEIERLRTSFYAEDDGYYRDTHIKPQWDRALDRLAEAKLAARAGREELQTILDEGRRAGALPGWLREGLEFEPASETLEDPREPRTGAESQEPDVVDEDGSGPPLGSAVRH